MKELKFSVVLKEVPVLLTGKDGVEKKFKLRELTSTQRAIYNESFDIKVELMDDGKAKAVAGEGFKTYSAKQFLAMCLYDEEDKLVKEEIIGGYPASMVGQLHAAALELSGMDEAALIKAKNASKGSGSSGTE